MAKLNRRLFPFLSILVVIGLLIGGCTSQNKATTPATAATTTQAAGAPQTATVTTTVTAAPGSASKVYTWKYVAMYAEGAIYNGIFPDLAKYVKEASNGRLILDMYPAEKLVPAAQIFDSIKKGAIDAGTAGTSHITGAVPIAALDGGYPGIINSPTEDVLLHDYYGFTDIERQAFAEQNCYYVDYTILLNKTLVSRQPINSLADLKGKKIRATGGIASVLAKAGGAVTNTAIPDLYTSLSTGVNDGVVFAGAIENNDLKLQEVAPYYLSPTLASACVTGAVLVNKPKWDELPADLKQIFIMAIRTYHQNWLYDYNSYQQAKLIKDLQAKGQFKYMSWSQDDMNTLAKYSTQVMEETAAKDKYAAAGLAAIKKYLADAGR